MSDAEEIRRVCQLLRWLIKEEVGLSLTEVDRRLGRPENTVSRWLRGSLSRLEQIFAILRVVGVSPREFYLRLALQASGPPLDPHVLGLVGMLRQAGLVRDEGGREAKIQEGASGDEKGEGSG